MTHDGFGGERPSWRRPSTIPRRDDRATAPLSLHQRRLWVVEQVKRNSSLYNVPLRIAITGPLDDNALRRALAQIVERHEVLRTAFPDVAGEARQVIADRVELPWRVVALEGLTGHGRVRRFREVAEEETQRPFDLRTGPPLRATVVRFSSRRAVLLLTVHHLVFDGWSLDVLVKELAALYDCCSHGGPSSLPELPIHYGDFAEWQRTQVTDDALAADRTYWRQALADAPELLQLPTDRPRPPIRSTAGARIRFGLSTARSAQIDALCRSEGVTPFVAFLSLLQVLLSRYARAPEVCVGVPIADRTLRETQSLLGLFVNMLVLRANRTGERTFRQLLAATKNAFGEARAHSRLPLDDVVRLLQRAGCTSYTPLFQVTFAFNPTPRIRARAGSLTLTAASADTSGAKFDLGVTIERRGRRFVGVVQYSTQLFDDETIRRLAAHYKRLIAGAVERPNDPLSTLRMASPEEQRRLIVDCNATSADYPADRTLPELFEEVVAARADEPAAIAPEEVITFRTLDARANRVARLLADRGAGPGSIVAVWLDRSIDLLVAVIGAGKAGAAYLPMHPCSPDDRIAFMLGDSNARVVLTHSTRVTSALPEHVARIDVDREDEGPADAACAATARATPNDIAYVIYTSGSTGEPKGVAIRQRSLVNFVTWYQRTYDVGPSDRACQIASPGFDACVWDIWGHLLAGAAVCIADEGALLTAPRLRDWFVRNRVTVGFVPTLLAERLYNEEWPRHAALRLMFIGGDRATCYPPPSVPFRVVNAYGPTEGTIVTTAGDVGADPGDGRLPHIGRPIANVQVYILDEHAEPVPIGIPGELCIAGEGVGTGYLRRPELTARTFTRNPFATLGEAMYRTGDLARYLRDGNIEFIGRIDAQVKIRGYRIELGEIEAVLKRSAGIRDAAVAVYEGLHGPSLAGYVVPDAAEGCDTHTLRTVLRKRLPDYMVPSVFVVLDCLPLTPSGKLDRDALPLPSPSAAPLPTARPRTALEARLVSIWSDVFGLPEVGIHDNFFDLGGHSLLAMQIASLSEGLFDADALFSFPTIEMLSQHIETPAAIVPDAQPT